MFSCQFCPKSYSNLLILKAHLQTKHKHSGEWRWPYWCKQNQCQKTYDDVDKWYRHVKKYHSNLERGMSIL